MGYSQKRVGKKGQTRYTSVYFDARGERRSAGTFSNVRDADDAWQAAEVKCREGRGVDPRKGRIRFERYVEDTWFPNHRIELLTRQTYRRRLDKYILPEFSGMRMNQIFPADVRSFVKRLEDQGKGPDLIWSIRTILSAIFTTALNDQIIFLHPCKGVKTPVIPEREYTIITPEQFDQLYKALPDADAQLLTETAIESGMRWGELTELRVKDLDFAHNLVTVRRTVVEVEAGFRINDERFAVKDYPKGRKNRRFKLSPSLMTKLKTHVDAESLSADDLLFALRQDTEPTIPDLPDPDTLGRTEPNVKGRTYMHGTLTGYTLGGCKCDYCRSAFARYRAERRAAGKDSPRGKRLVNTDGHIPAGKWRKQVWYPALKTAGIGSRVRFYDLRHSHASWLLAGGADLQVVKERMGHKSIRTTEIYLHTLPEADDTALAAFAKIRNRGGHGTVA